MKRNEEYIVVEELVQACGYYKEALDATVHQLASIKPPLECGFDGISVLLADTFGDKATASGKSFLELEDGQGNS